MTILPYSGEEPFGQQLAQIDGKHFVENQVEAVQIVGEAKRHEIRLDAPLKIYSHFACKFIEYHLTMEESQPPASSKIKNAFETLMSSQKRRLLPNKFSGEKLKGTQSRLPYTPLTVY